MCAPLNSRAATECRDARYQRNPPTIPWLPPYFFTRAACNPPHDVLGWRGVQVRGLECWLPIRGWGREGRVDGDVPPPVPTAGGSFFFGTNCRSPQGPPTVFDRLRQLFFNDALALGTETCPNDREIYFSAHDCWVFWFFKNFQGWRPVRKRVVLLFSWNFLIYGSRSRWLLLLVMM